MTRRRIGTICLVLLLTLMAAVPAAGHPAGPTNPGWSRILHDCGDDYGGHGDPSRVQDGAHDLVALDARVAVAANGGLRLDLALLVDDNNTVAVGATMPGAATQRDILLHFDSPRASVAVLLRENATGGFDVVSGPVYPVQVVPADDAVSGTRSWVVLELPVTGVLAPGDPLHGFQAASRFVAGGVWRGGDLMGGGSTGTTGEEACTGDAATWQHAGGFQIPTLPDGLGIAHRPSRLMAGEAATFELQGAGEAGRSVLWSIGGRQISGGTTVVVVLDQPGDWPVSATVGLANTTTNVTVHDRDRPLAAFTWFPSTFVAGERFKMIDQSRDLEHAIASWHWTIDGRPIDDQDLIVTGDLRELGVPADAAQVTVGLRVQDITGAIGFTEQVIQVQSRSAAGCGVGACQGLGEADALRHPGDPAGHAEDFVPLAALTGFVALFLAVARRRLNP